MTDDLSLVDQRRRVTPQLFPTVRVSTVSAPTRLHDTDGSTAARGRETRLASDDQHFKRDSIPLHRNFISLSPPITSNKFRSASLPTLYFDNAKEATCNM